MDGTRTSRSEMAEDRRRMWTHSPQRSGTKSQGSSPLLVLLLVAAIVGACARCVRAALVARGELRRCVHSGATSDVLSGAECKDVIVVTLTVPANKAAATETFTATVDAVSDPSVGVRKVCYLYLYSFATGTRINVRKFCIGNVCTRERDRQSMGTTTSEYLRDK